MAAASPVYWAFLSYCSHDRTTARWLQRALETYSVPRRLVGRATAAGPAPRQFRPIFRDRTELAADADLRARIQSALVQSAYLIVICSPHAAKSHWVDEEIARFRALYGQTRILTVILDGKPGDVLGDCFPPELRYGSDVSGKDERPEPIAADLRPGGDGRRMGFLKLVAGMLGVGLDELVRRDQQRRHRQLLAVACGALAGMAIMGALAIAAIVARNDAQRQRFQAEGLIEFMLTDLRKKLEPNGRLNLMDGVGDEALKYYRAQRSRDLDAQSLSRRARALRLMGEIKSQRGDLGEALSSFEQASATTGELLNRSPNEGQRIFDHAQNVFWVGEIARQHGKLGEAETSFFQYRGLAERLVVLDSTNDDWRAETVYAESALGVLFLEEGRSADATGAFERSLAVADQLANKHPKDVSLQIELGQGHAWLADSLQKQGHLAEARTHRETELSIYRAILKNDPTVRQAKFSIIGSLQVLGRLAEIRADFDGALADFTDAAVRAEALLNEERDNMDVTSLLAIARLDLGEALLAAGRLDAARTAQQTAATLLATALAHDGTVALWRNNRDRAFLLEAAIIAKAGQPGEALRLDQAVMKSLEGSGSNADTLWLLERSRLQSGDDLAAMNCLEEARKMWGAVEMSLAHGIDAYEPRLLIVLEAADQRLGRSAAAHDIAKRLASLSRPPGTG